MIHLKLQKLFLLTVCCSFAIDSKLPFQQFCSAKALLHASSLKFSSWILVSSSTLLILCSSRFFYFLYLPVAIKVLYTFVTMNDSKITPAFITNSSFSFFLFLLNSSKVFYQARGIVVNYTFSLLEIWSKIITRVR